MISSDGSDGSSSDDPHPAVRWESQTTAAAAAVSRLRVGGEKEIRFAPGGSGGTRDRVRVTGQRGGVS